MRIGIVTGASSGLGRAFAKEIDQTIELDELWLIARREDRLQRLSEELRCRGRVLPMDLTDPTSAGRLGKLLREEEPRIEILVCAAGFGKFGRAEDMSLEESSDMIALNCRAAVNVTRVSLPFMGQGSRILEICSSSAFQPLPGFNLYAATKAFLLHYTRALRWEVSGRGIRVTAVCPGWIKTNFMDIARDTDNPKAVGRCTQLAQRPEQVAAWALKMNAAGLAVATCSPPALVQRFGAKILPNCITMAAGELLRRI